MSLLTMADVARAVAAAEASCSRFSWYTTRSALSDPRGYRLDIDDDDRADVWVDGNLPVAEGFAALVTAIDELIGVGGNVVPLRKFAPYPPVLAEAANEG